MLLYHYSKTRYPSLLTKRKVGLLSKEEIKKADSSDRLNLLPGHSYIDHVSFFFDPVPSVMLSRIFGITHPVWHTGSKLFEHIIDTTMLDDDVIYEIVESDKKTKLFDEFVEEHNWTYDDPKLLQQWKMLELRKKMEWGEIGRSRKGLELQIVENGGHLDKAFLKAYNRADFEENRMKYAANVPHVMIYPKGGEIEVIGVNSLTIGNNTRKHLD
jgi:hypothetical protein